MAIGISIGHNRKTMQQVTSIGKQHKESMIV